MSLVNVTSGGTPFLESLRGTGIAALILLAGAWVFAVTVPFLGLVAQFFQVFLIVTAIIGVALAAVAAVCLRRRPTD